MEQRFTFADLTYLESMSMGSNEMIIEMVELFIEQIPEFTDGLQSLLKDSNYSELGALAHKAKSSVAVMGMNQTADLLKQLETDAKVGSNQETYPSLVQNAIDQMVLTGKELSDYVADLS